MIKDNFSSNEAAAALVFRKLFFSYRQAQQSLKLTQGGDGR
jgi:hypothetical protein